MNMRGEKKTISTNSQKVKVGCVSEVTSQGSFMKGFPWEESRKRGLVEQAESGQIKRKKRKSKWRESKKQMTVGGKGRGVFGDPCTIWFAEAQW